MAVCPKCGETTSVWHRDFLSGVCRNCTAGSIPTSLGCGTFIIIAIIVAIFSQPRTRDMEVKFSLLRKSVEEMRTAIESQTGEIKKLQATLDSLKADPKLSHSEESK